LIATTAISVVHFGRVLDYLMFKQAKQNDMNGGIWDADFPSLFFQLKNTATDNRWELRKDGKFSLGSPDAVPISIPSMYGRCSEGIVF